MTSPLDKLLEALPPMMENLYVEHGKVSRYEGRTGFTCDVCFCYAYTIDLIEHEDGCVVGAVQTAIAEVRREQQQ